MLRTHRRQARHTLDAVSTASTDLWINALIHLRAHQKPPTCESRASREHLHQADPSLEAEGRSHYEPVHGW